jgi:hypothetical protein
MRGLPRDTIHVPGSLFTDSGQKGRTALPGSGRIVSDARHAARGLAGSRHVRGASSYNAARTSPGMRAAPGPYIARRTQGAGFGASDTTRGTMRGIFIAFAGAATVLGLASTARAQTSTTGTTGTTSATSMTSEEAWRRDRVGSDFVLYLGAGGYVNGSATAFTNLPRGQNPTLFWPGFGAQSWIGYRFVPWMSVAGHLAYQNNPQRALPQGATSGTFNTFSSGVAANFYLGSAAHFRHWEPWFSVGVDPYAAAWASFSTPLGDINRRVTSVSIPFTLGVEYRVNRYFSAGLLAQASPWVPYQNCQSPTPGAAWVCSNQNLGTNTYLYFGAGVRVLWPH